MKRQWIFAASLLALLPFSINAQQVSDSTAIAGVAGAAPTLDCGAGQVKVGSSCAIIFQNGVTENAACASSGDITLGATAGKVLLSCQGGAWKKATGNASFPAFATETACNAANAGEKAIGERMYDDGAGYISYQGVVSCTCGYWSGWGGWKWMWGFNPGTGAGGPCRNF